MSKTERLTDLFLFTQCAGTVQNNTPSPQASPLSGSAASSEACCQRGKAAATGEFFKPWNNDQAAMRM